MKRKVNFVTMQQVEPSFWTARSTVVHHTLGILMPSHNKIQPDPATQYTHDCLLGRRERVIVRTGRVWQFLGDYNRSNHVGCLTVAGSLTSHTVWSRSGRSSTRVMPISRASMSVLPGARARRVDLLACTPATQLSCGLLLCALMYQTVLGYCTKHMQQPPPSLFPLPLLPSQPRLGKLSLSRAGFFDLRVFIKE